MSTPAAPAAGAAAPAAGAPPPAEKKIQTVPADIRRRVLGQKATPPPTAEEIEAKRIADEAAATAKKKADEEAAIAKKKKDDEEAAARAPAGATVEKVKKVKAGPPIPDPTTPPDNRTVEQVLREVLPEITRQNAPAAPAVDPEVQRELDLAAFAEKKNPDRYAGMAGKIKTFFTSNAELLTAKAKELGGDKSDEFKDYLESDEYKAWVAANRPSYARGDRTKLTEDLIAERARAEARQELEPELKKLERKTAELEHAPVIKARVDQALQIILTDPNAEKDPALTGFAQDPAKFGEAHPEEAQLIAAEVATAVDLIEEVYRIDRDLVDFDPKSPSSKHAEIRKFMVGQNALMREQFPNGMEMKDGSILIDAETYSAKKLEKDPRYRVFTADEIAGMLAAERNAKVLEKLKRRREGITKSVYAPKGEATATPPTGQSPAPQEDPPAPAAGSRAAPGTAVKSKDKKSLASKYA